MDTYTRENNRSSQRSNLDGLALAPSVARQLVPSSPKRRSITFFFVGSAAATVADSKAKTAGQGMFMGTAGTPIELTVEKHGQLVRREWWGISSAAGNISWIETFDD